jgi:hypothetical protein
VLVDSFHEVPKMAHNIANDYLDDVSKAIEDLSADLRTISLEIHDNPELQFKEFHAHDVLTKYMQDQEGWVVTPSAYGIKTAFVACYDTGRKGSVVSFNAEYGALEQSANLVKVSLIEFNRCSRRYRSRLRPQPHRNCFTWRCFGDCKGAGEAEIRREGCALRYTR